MIDFKITDNLIHLKNAKVSYIMKIQNGKLVHLYFGSALKYWNVFEEKPGYKRSYATEHEGFERPFDEIAFEYPEFGQGDYREDAISLKNETTGEDFFDFSINGLKVVDELLTPSGMPGIQGKGKTLIVSLFSRRCPLVLELYFGMNEDFSGIFRFQRLINGSEDPVEIKKLASASLDLAPQNWYLLSLAGTHIKEGSVQSFEPGNGKTILESRRGSSSSQHPPFVALSDGKPSWFSGEIIALTLLYSGNHAEIIEKDYYSQIRICMGLHQQMLDWKLQAGESFDTPQCILSWTDHGLNEMAQNFHHLFLDHLFRKETSPILINSWESFYYDTTSKNLLSLSESARKLGIELMVIDDGWFRKENNSRSAIGDWKVNMQKIPEGLDSLCSKIKEQGMQVGLWFEPEAVSGNSDLYKEHPQWILHLPSLRPTEGRHEYLLNLGLQEVQDHILEMFDQYLSSGLISYIKWDMNRPLTDLRKSMQSHQYILGLYRILDTLTKKYPDLIIEGCSSGGNRLDAGILSYVHQNWASDNTDPFDRLQIQSGLSLFLPPQKLTSHVSASANHQSGRISRLEDRYEIMRFFNPGYELDLSKMNSDEQKMISRQIVELKEDRDWMKEAEFFQTDIWWAKADQSRSRAEVLVFQEHFSPQNARMRLKIPFLKKNNLYEIQPLNLILSGEQIQKSGFPIPVANHDFQVRRFSFKQTSQLSPSSKNII